MLHLTCQPDYRYDQLTQAVCCCPSSPPPPPRCWWCCAAIFAPGCHFARSAEQKEGLTLHNVTTVEPSEAQDPGAGLPYINELMEDGGFEAFVDALAQNVTRANDDYVAQAGAKVVQAMVDVDGSFVDRLLQRLRDCTTPGTIAVVCCCCLLKATFTDALLRPNKDYLMSVLQQDQVSSLDVCQQKAAAVLQRLQTV